VFINVHFEPGRTALLKHDLLIVCIKKRYSISLILIKWKRFWGIELAVAVLAIDGTSQTADLVEQEFSYAQHHENFISPSYIEV
jgi:hypothetical protein